MELKRGERLDCSMCGGNDWSARKALNDERAETHEVTVTYVQLICKNCKHVEWFTTKVLDGP